METPIRADQSFVKPLRKGAHWFGGDEGAYFVETLIALLCILKPRAAALKAHTGSVTPRAYTFCSPIASAIKAPTHYSVLQADGARADSN